MSAPKIGSRWAHAGVTHHAYTVLHITNTAYVHERHPAQVVYRGDNGGLWSMPLADWPGKLLQSAAPAPATPAASVDTAEFQSALEDLVVEALARGLEAKFDLPKSFRAPRNCREKLVAMLDAHVAKAVATAAPQQHAQAALIDPIKLEDMRDWIVSNRPALTLNRQSTIDDYMSALATANAILAASLPAQEQPAITPTGEELYVMVTKNFKSGNPPWSMVGESGKAAWATAAADLVYAPDTIMARKAAPVPAASVPDAGPVKTWQERAGQAADCNPKPYARGWYWEHALAEIADHRAHAAAAPQTKTWRCAGEKAQIYIDVVLDVGLDAVGAEILLMNPIRKYKLENFRNINGKGHGTVRMPLDEAAALKFAPPQEAPTFAVPKSYPPYSVASAVSIVCKSTPASLTQFGESVIHMQYSGFPGIPESTENYNLPIPPHAVTAKPCGCIPGWACYRCMP